DPRADQVAAQNRLLAGKTRMPAGTDVVLSIALVGADAVKEGLAKVGESFNEIGRAANANLSPANQALQSIASTLSIATRAVQTFGVALIGRDIVEFGARMLESAARIQEVAAQVGLATSSLQELQFAARQSGISSEELQTSLARFSRAIGEAASGNDVAIKAFHNLGVGILDAGGHLRSTESILNDVADAIEKIEDPAKRTAAEVELFGRSGFRLGELFKEGSAGLR